MNKNVLGREKELMYGKADDPIIEDLECPNCKEVIPGAQAMAHTIQCYRNSTKCRVCSEVVHKNKKKQHLEKWRNLEVSLLKLTDNLGAFEANSSW